MFPGKQKSGWNFPGHGERHLFQGIFGGLFGGKHYGGLPEGFFAQGLHGTGRFARGTARMAAGGAMTAVGAVPSTLGAFAGGVGAIRGAAYQGYRGLRQWSQDIGGQRQMADALQSRQFGGATLTAEQASTVKRYGRGESGHRKFFARSGAGHLEKGAANIWKHGIGNIRMFWGLNVAMGVAFSKDNLAAVHGGFVQNTSEFIGAELGFMGGAAAGAAAGSLLGPIGSAVGLIAGAFGGAEAGAAIANIPWALADIGRKYGRHSKPFQTTFMDSEYAATMRQRGVQTIYRSQMNARSAFGNEAMALHM